MPFRIRGLDPAAFVQFYGRSDADLAAVGIRRCRVDRAPGFPDRVELRDGEPGETMLLMNYEHQPAETPYRSSHAIFVREGAQRPFDAADCVPEMMRIRPISLRAFDARGEMVKADPIDGTDLEPLIERMLAQAGTDYLHAHYAKRGCYAARIERL